MTEFWLVEDWGDHVEGPFYSSASKSNIEGAFSRAEYSVSFENPFGSGGRLTQDMVETLIETHLKDKKDKKDKKQRMLAGGEAKYKRLKKEFEPE